MFSRIPEITAEQENFRLEGMFVKRDPVEPVPIGTLIVIPFRVTGYDPDCDGSLMARLEAIDEVGMTTGWEQDSLSLYPTAGVIIESVSDLFERAS